MSLLFPDHIRIGLGASYAALARVRGRQIVEWHIQEFTPEGQPSWQQAVQTVNVWLQELPAGNAKVSVMLSSELALLHLLPWRDDVMSAEPQKLLAASFFRRVYGIDIDHWKTCVWPTGYGAPWIASATDASLLQALQELMPQHQSRLNLRLVSIEPLALGLFNALRHRLTGHACWFLVQEPQRLTALHLREQQWQLLQMLPAGTLQEAGIGSTLLRETRLAGLEDETAPVYVVTSDIESSADGRLNSYIGLPSGWKTAYSITGRNPLHLIGAKA